MRLVKVHRAWFNPDAIAAIDDTEIVGVSEIVLVTGKAYRGEGTPDYFAKFFNSVGGSTVAGRGRSSRPAKGRKVRRA